MPDVRVEEVAGIARQAARAVDEDARFPCEAVGAMRDRRLLAPQPHLGLVWLAEAVAAISRCCGSSGLVFAMHHAQFETVRRYAPSDGWAAAFLRDAIRDQPLVASLTSEVGLGGDLGRSGCAVEARDGVLELRKSVPAASYARHADVLVLTARRSPEAAATDQVLAIARADQVNIDVRVPWDALGMRGTSTDAVDVSSRIDPTQVLDRPFAEMSGFMIAVSHVLWGACWTGIAAEAVDVARATLRHASGARNGELDATRRAAFADAAATVSSMWSLVVTAARRADTCFSGDATSPAAMPFFNGVKLTTSENAVAVVLGCFEIVGIAAYQEPGQSNSSMGRHIRDVLSSLVMVSNHRIRAASGLLALVAAPEIPSATESSASPPSHEDDA